MEPGVVKRLQRLRRELRKELRYCWPATRPRRVLFDHLPKCGGSSLNLYLQAHYPSRKVFSIDGHDPGSSLERFKALPQDKRHGYDLVKGHYAHALLDDVHPERLAITVFREPVERIVSHYYYARRSAGHYLHARIHASRVSLEEYATSDLSGELRNWYTTHFSGLTLLEAERNPEEAVALAARVVLERYDLVGFLDDFGTFAGRLQVQARFWKAYRNRRVNVTADRPALDRVPESAIRRIRELNRLDIAFYGKIREAVG